MLKKKSNLKSLAFALCATTVAGLYAAPVFAATDVETKLVQPGNTSNAVVVVDPSGSKTTITSSLVVDGDFTLGTTNVGQTLTNQGKAITENGSAITAAETDITALVHLVEARFLLDFIMVRIFKTIDLIQI